MGYRERDKVFYLSPTNWKGEEEDVVLHHDTWDEHWLLENERFEKLLQATQTLCTFPTKCFFYGMGTIICKPGCLKSTSCTTMRHPGQHISIDLILLNTSHRLVKFLTTMTNLNKYIFFFVYFMNLLFFCFFPIFHFSS